MNNIKPSSISYNIRTDETTFWYQEKIRNKWIGNFLVLKGKYAGSVRESDVIEYILKKTKEVKE